MNPHLFQYTKPPFHKRYWEKLQKKSHQAYAITRPTIELGNSEIAAHSVAVIPSWKWCQIKHPDLLCGTVSYLHTIRRNTQHFNTPAAKNRSSLLKRYIHLDLFVKSYIREVQHNRAGLFQRQGCLYSASIHKSWTAILIQISLGSWWMLE
jgi:hypothetical protein